MSHTRQEIVRILSDIEPTARTYEPLTDEDVPELRELLHHDEGWLAARVVYALGKVGSPEALNALEQAVSSDRSEVRVALAASAVALPRPQADSILRQLLMDEDIGVVKFAVESVQPRNAAAVHDALTAVTARELPATIDKAAHHKLEEIQEMPMP
jgi:HEAT repeat protein